MSCAFCGRSGAHLSHRLADEELQPRLVCARCYFGSIPPAEREATDRGWARRDLAGQVRAVAKRLPARDSRAGRLRDLALDLELAASDHAAVPVIGQLREAGLKVAMRDG